MVLGQLGLVDMLMRAGFLKVGGTGFYADKSMDLAPVVSYCCTIRRKLLLLHLALLRLN